MEEDIVNIVHYSTLSFLFEEGSGGSEARDVRSPFLTKCGP